MGPAPGHQVVERGDPAVGHRVQVVPLQAVAASTALVHAACALEVRRCSQLQRRAQLGGDVAPEMRHGVDAAPVVQNCLQERIPAHVPGHCHRYRSPTDDGAYLTGLRGAPPPGRHVAHDHEFGPRGLRRAPAVHQRHEGVGGRGRPYLALLDGRRPAEAVALGVEPVDECDADLGGQRGLQADHAQAVAPVAEPPGLVLAAMQDLHVGGGQAAATALVPQQGQRRASGQGHQLGLAAGALGLGGGDLPGLLQRQLAGCQRGGRGRAPLGRAGGGELLLRPALAGAADLSQPASRVPMAERPLGPAGGHLERRRSPGSRAGLLHRGQLRNDRHAVLAGDHRRVEPRQRSAKRLSGLHHGYAHASPPSTTR